MSTWTTPADIRARVRRRWDDGTILRALAAGSPFPTIDVALRGPRTAEIGDDLDAVRVWIAELESAGRTGSRYTLVRAGIGGRLIGRNEVPIRAIVESYEQAIALMGVVAQVRSFELVLDLVAAEPDLHAWVATNPLRALSVADLWPTLLAAYRWLRDARGSNRYLREIDAPGVDTKFVELHRAVLGAALGVRSTASGFVTDLGLRAKPELLRLRLGAHVDSTVGLSDVTARADELASLPLRVRRALIVENEVTFLSVPVPADGVVLWGKGFEVDRAASMPWLTEAPIDYWGDLDTHGFAILNQLRAWLPQTRSVLMDRETLLAHRDRWVREPSPTRAVLQRLTDDEAMLYRDLVTDHFDERTRLEQERIDWSWALARLASDDQRATQ